MGVYFGTDGIRGKFREELDFELAYSCGNALASKFENIKILIGRDTRLSGSFISLAFSCGAMQAGADIVDIGVCPTAGISFLTKNLGFDYGVVISASHNPAEFNGIKIFDKSGIKLSEEKEILLEKKFFKKKRIEGKFIGSYEYNPILINKYIEFLSNLFDFDFNGKKIVLDCSNGSNSNISEAIFKSKGAEIISYNSNFNGENINKNCGCTHIENLKEIILQNDADFGFAFDGDGDRLIAVDKNGKIFDGDKIVYIFSKYLKKKGKLKNSVVVGTKHTNMGVEIALKKKGIELIRTDIGDKFVGQKIREIDAVLGGEQSGHIILSEIMPTGDGLLSSLFLSFILISENKDLSSYIDFKDFEQENINIEVKNKHEIINDTRLNDFLRKKETELLGIGRIMLRVSGTEPCIRIMVETQSGSVSKKIANEFVEIIKQIDGEHRKCAE